MDLLNANEMRESELNGVTDQDGWLETRNTYNMNATNRASNNFLKMTSSGRRDRLSSQVSIYKLESISNLQTDT